MKLTCCVRQNSQQRPLSRWRPKGTTLPGVWLRVDSEKQEERSRLHRNGSIRGTACVRACDSMDSNNDNFEMSRGSIGKTGSGWLLTEEGRQKSTGWSLRVFDPDWWKPSTADEIAEYVKDNDNNPDLINRKW